MKNFLLYIVLFLHASAMHGQQFSDFQRPKLVVGIVVDQMRWDYLYRYYDRYSDNGFKKLIKEGNNCQNTMINYVPSFTGPGHAAIYTGTVPAINGIAANDWIDVKKNKSVYCVEDKTVSSVGGSIEAGMMSPVNMYSTTITDELQIATQQKAKIFGIGLKDRGSILPAGHAADGAFWFDDSTGNFITSSYYMQELPKWLLQFNDKRWADTVQNTIWDLLYPLNTYANSIADENGFEGILKGESNTSFPHKTPKRKGRGYNGIRYMPGGNTLTLKAAVACMNGEDLGKDAITDFLCVTLSTTDYAGHNFGPDAVEMEDMYLRLDQDIAEMLEYLDMKVGKGQYTVFLTADHGAAHNAGYMQSLKIPAGSKTQVDVTENVNAYIKEQLGYDSLVLSMYNYQVYLNENLVEKRGIDREEVKTTVIKWLDEKDEIAFVIDMEDMDDVVAPEPIRSMVINGYYKARSGCIQIIMKPGWYSGHGSTGTTHGTWNPYDSHIPLLWYGWGINKGETYSTVSITDIAPTLAALLRIQMPNGCTGKVIEGVLKAR